MAEHRRLLTRLSAGMDGINPVAWLGREPVDEAGFRGRVAAWTAAFEASPGAAVALYHTDGLQFAAALFGAWQAGKTVFLAGDNLPDTCRQLAAHVQHFAGEWPVDYAPLHAGAVGSHSPARPLAPEFIGVVVFTSGSTGERQAIPKKLAQLAEEVENLEHVFGSEVGDAMFVATVSHQHIYGLLFKILWPLATRRSFLAQSVVFPEQLSAELAGRNTALVSSPALLKRLPSAVNWDAARAGVRAVFSSGGLLPADAAVLCEALLGVTPIEVYGSSETGGIASRRCKGGADALWAPLPGVHVRDQDGCLCVSSLHLPDEAWFVTADRAVFTSEAAFTLAGRVDRIAKIEGKRVSLTAIEQTLAASPWVIEASVFPLHVGREQLAAVVVATDLGRQQLAREGHAAFTRNLRIALADSTERVALPRRWRFVDAMPVNSQGKTTFAELAALFATGAPTLPSVTVLEQTPAHAALELSVAENVVYFDGHFPEAPVLAGIVQVHWAIHYARSHLGVRGNFVRLEAVKFHRLIPPGSLVRLDLDWRAESASLVFRMDSAAGPHSSGRVVFAL